MTRKEQETLRDLVTYLYDFARKQDDVYGKWDCMSIRLEELLEWIDGRLTDE